MDHNGSIIHIDYDQHNQIFITMGQDSSIQIQKYTLDMNLNKAKSDFNL
jgi:hypothetical protein